MATIFERIIAGEIPCHKVWEDEKHLAFLDINPVVDGHTLIIPKKAMNYIFDLSPADYRGLWTAAQTVEAVLRKKLACQRVIIAVYGFEVPHAHIHLLPANTIKDVSFPARDPAAKERVSAIAQRLKP